MNLHDTFDCYILSVTLNVIVVARETERFAWVWRVGVLEARGRCQGWGGVHLSSGKGLAASERLGPRTVRLSFLHPIFDVGAWAQGSLPSDLTSLTKGMGVSHMRYFSSHSHPSKVCHHLKLGLGLRRTPPLKKTIETGLFYRKDGAGLPCLLGGACLRRSPAPRL